MAGFTTAMPTTYKSELAQALHDHTTTTGHVFKVALGIASPAGTYGAATTNYSDLTGNSDEVPPGGGYTTGGFAWTANQNITPTSTGVVAFWQWSTNPTWSGATFSTSGCVIYNSTSGNRAVYIGGFGVQSVTAGTLTLIQPSYSAATALLRIA